MQNGGLEQSYEEVVEELGGGRLLYLPTNVFLRPSPDTGTGSTYDPLRLLREYLSNAKVVKCVVVFRKMGELCRVSMGPLWGTHVMPTVPGARMRLPFKVCIDTLFWLQGFAILPIYQLWVKRFQRSWGALGSAQTKIATDMPQSGTDGGLWEPSM